MISPVCANYERAIGAFFTGFITRTKRCASIESSTAPKRIAVSDANRAVRSMLVCPKKRACHAEALAKAGHSSHVRQRTNPPWRVIFCSIPRDEFEALRYQIGILKTGGGQHRRSHR